MKAFYQFLKLYWRVRRPVTLGSRAIVVRDGRVRLVRLSYVEGWYLPGGGVDRGESFEQAVLRELREECAIEALAPKLFGLYFTDKQGKQDHVAIYVITDFRQIAGATPDREIIEQQDFPLNALPDATTPATRRRLEEYLGGRAQTDQW